MRIETPSLRGKVIGKHTAPGQSPARHFF